MDSRSVICEYLCGIRLDAKYRFDTSFYQLWTDLPFMFIYRDWNCTEYCSSRNRQEIVAGRLSKLIILKMKASEIQRKKEAYMIKILISVRDDRIRTHFSKALKEHNIFCLECYDKAKLPETVESSGVQLILMDADAGDIERIDSEYPDIPIIALTGEASGIERIAYLEHGARDVVNKESIPEELAARIKAIIRRKRGIL